MGNFNAGVDITLDGAGNGTARVGPTFGPATWHVTTVAVKTSQPGQGLIPQCALYVGTQDANGYVDTTYDGSANFADIDRDVVQGGQVIAVWTGGNPGNTATLSISGTRE